MRPDEIVVARMGSGLSIGRCVEVSTPSATNRSGRVRISTGRNKEARLPADRIVLATGVVTSGSDQVEVFRQKCESLSSSIELSEIWEVVKDEANSFSLDDLAELYWGASPDPAQKVALLFRLEEPESLYFVSGKDGYTARTQESLEEIQARRRREEENTQAAAELMECLSSGKLPSPKTPHQRSLLDHLRGYAIHGESYTRNTLAQKLVGNVKSGTRDPQRLSFELLVGVGIMSPDEPLELERAEIPTRFSDDVLEETHSLDLSRTLKDSQREDLTSLPVVTIDDEGSEDKDDALSLEVEGRGSENPIVYRIGIHIADAGALIPTGGALDQEADRRMSTLYLPERRIPMLPLEIGNQMGSLLPGEKRAALSLLARITDAGEVLGWEAIPSIIRSQAALSYVQADGAIDDHNHSWHSMLDSLTGLARSLRQKREAAGAINFNRPEMMIKVAESGEIKINVQSRSTQARQMVAEFMILCNSLLAEFCRDNSLPAAYRSQAAPDLGELEAILQKGVDISDDPLLRYLMVRRFPPADLDTVPAPHNGLGVAAYLQATSPLRRYPDLVMQRQISHFLSAGRPLYSTEEIASVAQRAEVQLRELGRLEEERRRYWFLKYLKQIISDPEIGDEASLFQAVVLENQPRRTAMLEMADYPFRMRTELPPTIAPGDEVTLRLHGVDLWRRTGQFVHVPSPE